MTREQLKQMLSQQNASPAASRFDVLSEPELEVFSIMSQGYSASQIHSQFGFDPNRLSELKRSIQKKLGLRSEFQLLRLAAEQGRSH